MVLQTCDFASPSASARLHEAVGVHFESPCLLDMPVGAGCCGCPLLPIQLLAPSIHSPTFYPPAHDICQFTSSATAKHAAIAQQEQQVLHHFHCTNIHFHAMLMSTIRVRINLRGSIYLTFNVAVLFILTL